MGWGWGWKNEQVAELLQFELGVGFVFGLEVLVGLYQVDLVVKEG